MIMVVAEENNLLKKGAPELMNEDIGLEGLYREYFPKVYNFFFYRLLHKENAEDLTGCTFLKIAEHLHTYDPEKSKLGTWIWQISENTLVDFYRTQKRTFPLDEAVDEVSTRCISFEEQYALIINPEYRALYTALFKLPQRDRMLVYYKYLMGFSYHEIADEFRMNESTLASALWRAKEKLRKELGKHGDNVIKRKE